MYDDDLFYFIVGYINFIRKPIRHRDQLISTSYCTAPVFWGAIVVLRGVGWAE